MTYLLLAILSSALISVLMRFGDSHIKNDMVMFMANYAACMLLSAYYMKDHIIISGANGMKGIQFAIGIGLLNGAMYLLNFTLLHLNINRNGVILSSMFMRLGVLVPTFMAIFLFKEHMKLTQIFGFLIAVTAIIILNSDRHAGASQKRGGKVWLIVLLFMSGLTDSLANVYDKCGVSVLKDHYLLFTFFAAFVLSVIGAKMKKERIRLNELAWGLAIGVPNYYSARFLLLALGKLSAILVYPVYNVATILVISLCGVLFFKEKLKGQKGVGLLLILLALVFLNI